MKRQELKKLKIKFVEEQEEKESKKLQRLREKHHHFSDSSNTYSTSRFYHGNYPDDTDVRLARKDHICFHSSCNKKIKKGSFYFRRSFGQMWTIKACSIECFCWKL